MSDPLPPLRFTSPSGKGIKLKNACRDFESLFLHTLLREGRGDSAVSTSSQESRALAILQDMRDESMGQEMAKAGGVGLGQMLYKDLQKNLPLAQENAQEFPRDADKESVRRNCP